MVDDDDVVHCSSPLIEHPASMHTILPLTKLKLDSHALQSEGPSSSTGFILLRTSAIPCVPLTRFLSQYGLLHFPQRTGLPSP